MESSEQAKALGYVAVIALLFIGLLAIVGAAFCVLTQQSMVAAICLVAAAIAFSGIANARR